MGTGMRWAAGVSAALRGRAKKAGTRDGDSGEARQTGVRDIQAGRDAYVASRDIVINVPAKPGVAAAVMTAYQESRPDGGWSMDSPVRHEGTQVGDRLVIGPQHPYLDLVASGADLAPGFPSWDTLPPRLDIKIVNNSPETILVYQVDLDIAQSGPCTHSVPVVTWGAVKSGFSAVEAYGPVKFFPVNLADGERAGIAQVTLVFHLEDPDSGAALSAEYRWENYSNGDRVTAENWVHHPLIAALAEVGVRPEDPSSGSTWISWDRGEFGDTRRVGITGTLEYVQLGEDDAPKQRSHRFRSLILIAPANPIQPYMLKVSKSYVAPKLREQGKNYSLKVPVSHYLPAGKADRFLIKLPAEVPSVHDFHVSVLWKGGVIDCGAVHMETWDSALKEDGIEVELAKGRTFTKVKETRRRR